MAKTSKTAGFLGAAEMGGGGGIPAKVKPPTTPKIKPVKKHKKGKKA